MSITFSSTGTTRITWSLSESLSPGSAAMSAEQKSTRSISYGTGPNQATIGHTARLTATGTATTSLDLFGISVPQFGSELTLAFTSIREMLIQVTSGPTGGYLTCGLPTGGVSGVRVQAGGAMHWIGYQNGISISDSTNLTMTPGVTGTYGIDVTLIGVGGY